MGIDKGTSNNDYDFNFLRALCNFTPISLTMDLLPGKGIINSESETFDQQWQAIQKKYDNRDLSFKLNNLLLKSLSPKLLAQIDSHSSSSTLEDGKLVLLKALRSLYCELIQDIREFSGLTDTQEVKNAYILWPLVSSVITEDLITDFEGSGKDALEFYLYLFRAVSAIYSDARACNKAIKRFAAQNSLLVHISSIQQAIQSIQKSLSYLKDEYQLQNPFSREFPTISSHFKHQIVQLIFPALTNEEVLKELKIIESLLQITRQFTSEHTKTFCSILKNLKHKISPFFRVDSVIYNAVKPLFMNEEIFQVLWKAVEVEMDIIQENSTSNTEYFLLYRGTSNWKLDSMKVKSKEANSSEDSVLSKKNPLLIHSLSFGLSIFAGKLLFM